MTSLLIDADGIAFKIASAIQRTIDWGDEIVSVATDLAEGKRIFSAQVEGLVEAAEVDLSDVVLCWSCPTRRYFRHDILPSYKGNRKGGTAPVGLKFLKDWAQEAYPSKTKPGLEADDVLGILATHPKLYPKAIIWSGDKDLHQIPGKHLDAEEGIFRISPAFSERFLWEQVLTGDAADGYSGCPGIGKVKAERMLAPADPADYETIVTEAYLKAGLTVEDMAVQFNVARLLTADCYNFKKKEPILWQPST